MVAVIAWMKFNFFIAYRERTFRSELHSLVSYEKETDLTQFSLRDRNWNKLFEEKMLIIQTMLRRRFSSLIRSTCNWENWFLQSEKVPEKARHNVEQPTIINSDTFLKSRVEGYLHWSDVFTFGQFALFSLKFTFVLSFLFSIVVFCV